MIKNRTIYGDSEQNIGEWPIFKTLIPGFYDSASSLTQNYLKGLIIDKRVSEFISGNVVISDGGRLRVNPVFRDRNGKDLLKLVHEMSKRDGCLTFSQYLAEQGRIPLVKRVPLRNKLVPLVGKHVTKAKNSFRNYVNQRGNTLDGVEIFEECGGKSSVIDGFFETNYDDIVRFLFEDKSISRKRAKTLGFTFPVEIPVSYEGMECFEGISGIKQIYERRMAKRVIRRLIETRSFPGLEEHVILDGNKIFIDSTYFEGSGKKLLQTIYDKRGFWTPTAKQLGLNTYRKPRSNISGVNKGGRPKRAKNKILFGSKIKVHDTETSFDRQLDMAEERLETYIDDYLGNWG